MELEVVAIKYVGPATVKRLAEHGITTVEQLAAMSVEALTALPGIGENTAPLIIANAQEILDASVAEPEIETETPEPVAVESTEVITEVTPETSPEPELSEKAQKKLAKQAKKLKKAQKAEKKSARKAAKKAEKKAKKQLKAEQSAVEKAEKKAAKQAKKAEKKAAKSKG
jgi:transcription termination factor NusA